MAQAITYWSFVTCLGKLTYVWQMSYFYAQWFDIDNEISWMAKIDMTREGQ